MGIGNGEIFPKKCISFGGITFNLLENPLEDVLWWWISEQNIGGMTKGDMMSLDSSLKKLPRDSRNCSLNIQSWDFD